MLKIFEYFSEDYSYYLLAHDKEEAKKLLKIEAKLDNVEDYLIDEIDKTKPRIFAFSKIGGKE